MFDKSAIDTLAKADAIDQASKSVSRALSSNNGAAALPSEFQLHDLEKFMPHRRRVRGSMETSSVTDFAAYVGQHAQAGSTVFVSHKTMSAVAVLDLGTTDHPGHAEHRATIKPDMTAAYASLRNTANGRALEQSTVAEFLEDWAPHIKCADDQGPIAVKHAVAAVRKITVEGLRKVEASEEQLSASKSSFESVKATSTQPLPTLIEFRCVPYHGFTERTFALRLGIRTTDKPAITLRVVNSELHDEEMSQELANRVTLAVSSVTGDESCLVLIGEYTAR